MAFNPQSVNHSTLRTEHAAWAALAQTAETRAQGIGRHFATPAPKRCKPATHATRPGLVVRVLQILGMRA